ncbi:hypothetical protein [Eubacterium sp.]|uniref:hypothetical protein n=1 Tax=Eubacterium sp. TaxID=142586 RepID=UPI0025DB082F|nr:hypothetical protein [Eubacterium sp.]MCR5629177.1 hypothetical protein [Eubacterium sp.]
MRKIKRIVGLFSFGALMVMAALPVSASKYMDGRLSASFHWLPVLKDSATGTTFYGTNEYYKTAEAYVKVEIYDGSSKTTASCTRYGWDAVSGEGDKGPCDATAKRRNADKAKGIHKGKKNKNNNEWTEIAYTNVKK